MSRKISVDLTDENFEALDKFKESRNDALQHHYQSPITYPL